MERVGFGTRFLAGLIDLFIIGLIPMVIQLFVGKGFFPEFVLFVLFVAYTYLDVLRAQSPGKQLMGIKIYSANGQRATNEALMNRWLFKLVPNLIRFIGALTALGFISVLGDLAAVVLIGGFFLILDEQRLALHDRIAGTAVYRAD